MLLHVLPVRAKEGVKMELKTYHETWAVAFAESTFQIYVWSS